MRRSEIDYDRSRKASGKFLDSLRTLGGNLEVLYVKGQWHLYNVKLFGTVSSDDSMVYQRTFYECNDAAIAEIQKSLHYNHDGGRVVDEADLKKILKRKMQAAIINQYLKRDRRIADVCADIKISIMKHAYYNVRHFQLADTPVKMTRPGWRKLDGCSSTK